MRVLLASTGLGTLSILMASYAGAETVVSTATTTPLSTSSSGDIHITSAGSIKPTGGAAVTINSNNAVKNEGTIAISGANGATGILAGTNLSGDITNANIITIDEDYTPEDSDKDGDPDGPFAKGSDRFGIHVLSGGTYTGNILNSGAITIEGNNSAGIAIDSALAGSLTSNGKISVTGDNSAGIRAGAVSGNVTIGSGSSTNVQGANSVGVLLGGDIGGALVIQGTVNTTGYRFTTAPLDPSKLDSDDLLQGGSAVVVNGSVSGGILLDSKPADTDPNQADEDHDGTPDANETTASLTTFGAAPAMAIGSATSDINIGAVAGSSLGHGIVIKGSVSGIGVYDGITATGLSIGGTGHSVNVTGGMTLLGSVSATASKASATAIHIGSGAKVPQIVVGGTVSASGGGAEGASSTGILIDSGATVNAISNSGTIAAARTGDSGTAAAIVDLSGTLSIIQNNGAIGVTSRDLGDSGTAIDLRANSTGAVIRQVAAASGAPAPLISGNILFGSGNDTLDVQAGSVLGKVDFGGGSDVMSLSGGALFRGQLANSSALQVSVGSGSTLDVQNLGTVDLASLTAAENSSIGVTIGDSGHTLYNVSGTASFGAGSKILVTLDHVGTAQGTYEIIDAGTIDGIDNLTSSIVTLPFLFNSKLITDAGSGEVALDIERKDSGTLGLNRSETAILDAALDAADLETSFSALFLKIGDSAGLKDTLQQLMPDHAGGAFETATKGSRLAAGILSDPRPINGLWLQQVAWGSSKSIGDTSSYSLSGWGATGGYDIPLGPALSVGVTGAYLWGKDGHGSNELVSNHYEGGLYARGGVGGFSAWARATIGTIKFDSQRNFNSTIDGAALTRTAEGSWRGTLYSGTAGLSYEAKLGRFSVRPNASLEYYKLKEKGYSETGGGDAFDLIVDSRSSDESAANALLTLGYDLMAPADEDGGWLRVEAEGGRREILSGTLGDTTAQFKDGTPFTLAAEDRTSGWRGGVRVTGGGSSVTFVAELNAEQQQGNVSIGGRAGLRLGF
ncbi:MAG TPA: autotransporter domain-containing protein [Sphingomicrobium sp.]|nr:autotransporter domain-containing protein [Sphingomicrobium sp.]